MGASAARSRRGRAQTTALLAVLIAILGIITLQQWRISGPKRWRVMQRREATIGVEELSAALRKFHEDRGRFPKRLSELRSLPTEESGGTRVYIESIRDPACRSQAYFYERTPEGIRFGSLGTDGRLGGKRYGEDILESLPPR